MWTPWDTADLRDSESGWRVCSAALAVKARTLLHRMTPPLSYVLQVLLPKP